MKTKLILFALLISFAAAFAQDKAKLQKADESGFIEVDKLPALKSQLKPHYPEIARLAGIEGTVYLKILVDENGDVEKAKVEQGAKDMLDNSALEAAKKAKFSPAMMGDKPVKVWVILPVAFKLEVKQDEDINPPAGTEDEPNPNELVKVEKLPEIIEAPKPDYPAIAKKAGIEGKVFVKVLVGKDGNPQKAMVIRSDNKIFNQTAIDAAMKSKFTPAVNKGEKIAVWIVLPYKFALSEGVNSSENIPSFEWLITSKQSDYPSAALEKKLEGKVTLKVLLTSPDKNVKQVDVIKGPNEILKDAAKEYVKNNMNMLLERYEHVRQLYFEQHPKGVKEPLEIKDAAIITIMYKIEE